MKKALKAIIAVFISLTAVVPVFAVDDQVLLEDGVEVSMSSSEMDPASTALNPGDAGTARSSEWFKSDLTEVKNKNTQFDSLDLVSLEGVATIQIDDDKTYQNFLGMGSSIDEASVNNLMKMDESTRQEVLDTLIDPVNGLGYTLFRLTIGTSDFAAADFYTYYDTVPEDGNYDWYNETGKGFSIEKDYAYHIIDTVKQIQATASKYGVADDIKFFASSWTPPGWMKDMSQGMDSVNRMFSIAMMMCERTYGKDSPEYKRWEEKSKNEYNYFGGALKDEYVDELAKYYVRYIEEYAKAGIDIYAITLQNEPENVTAYPSCLMTAQQHAQLSNYIRQELENSTILSDCQKEVKLWGFDHNFSEGMNWADIMYNTENSLDGIALHDYSGTPDQMQEISVKYPDKTVTVTERSLWGTYGMNRIVEYFRNNAISYNAWVTMLDQNCETHQFLFTCDPTLLIQDVDNRNNYRISPEAYMMGQFTKYIRPGYVRVDSTDTIGTNDFGISNVVFKDPDTGKLVMVVVNNSNEDQTFTAACDDYQFSATVPACNVATYQWNPNDIDVSAPNISGNDATIYVGDTTDLKTILNLKVTDDKDGEISEYTINDNGYNCQKAGKYVIEVSASDKAGNETKANFTVTVKEKEAVVENTENKGDSTNKPTKQETTNSSNAVKTGDESQLEIYGAVVLGLAVIGGLYVTRKKLIKK